MSSLWLLSVCWDRMITDVRQEFIMIEENHGDGTIWQVIVQESTDQEWMQLINVCLLGRVHDIHKECMFGLETQC